MNVALTVLSLGVFASFGAAEPKNSDTLIYADFTEADTLDPAWADDRVSQGIIRALYEPLWTYQPERSESYLPLIAARIPARSNGLVSADGKVWRIPIRRGITFHDGSALTAEDVRYSLLRFMLEDRDGGPSALLLQPLLRRPSTRDVHGVPDPHVYREAARAVMVQGEQVVLNLPAAFAPLPGVLAAVPIVSARWARENGGWDGSEATWTRFNNPRKQDSPFFARADGTGPFRLERWDRRARELVLVRHEGYWGRAARLKKVVFRVVPEFGTRRLMLEAGDADLMASDFGYYGQLQGIANARIDNTPRMGVEPVAYFNFLVDMKANPDVGSGRLDGEGIPSNFFSDPDVRKAFAYAVDYEGFIHDVYRGKAVRATGCLPRGMLGHDATIKPYAYDPDKALEHFRKAWGGQVWEKGFRFTLTYNTGNSSRQILCQMIKRGVESLNPKFRVDIRGIDWPTYLDAFSARKLPVTLLNLSPDYPDPHGVAFDAMHSRGAQAKVQGYSNPEADRLVEEAAGAVSPRRREELYRRLQRIEHEDLPHLLFVEPQVLRVSRDWVKGLAYDPMALYPHFDLAYKESPAL